MTAASSESPTPAGEDLSALQRALLDAGSCDRLFAVVSWGAAATMWLAKTLNAHPEMLCLHAGTDTIIGLNTAVYYLGIALTAPLVPWLK